MPDSSSDVARCALNVGRLVAAVLAFQLSGFPREVSILRMKMTNRLPVYLVAIAALAITAPQAWSARPKKRKYTPPPAPTATPAPSVDLSHFVGNNLDRILGPLEVRVPLPRAELAQLRVSFASRFSKASLAERAQFQGALAVCDAISQAMDERNTAMLNPAASNWAQCSAQLRQNIEKLVADERAVEASVTPAPGR